MISLLGDRFQNEQFQRPNRNTSFIKAILTSSKTLVCLKLYPGAGLTHDDLTKISQYCQNLKELGIGKTLCEPWDTDYSSERHELNPKSERVSNAPSFCPGKIIFVQEKIKIVQDKKFCPRLKNSHLHKKKIKNDF